MIGCYQKTALLFAKTSIAHAMDLNLKQHSNSLATTHTHNTPAQWQGCAQTTPENSVSVHTLLSSPQATQKHTSSCRITCVLTGRIVFSPLKRSALMLAVL